MIAREIDGRRFVTTGNPHGRSGAETVFAYRVDETGAITGSYAGGEIHAGQVVGRVTGADGIELLFQCVTTAGVLLSGRSRGVVSRGGDGLLRLDFEWSWLSGDEGGGTSAYVELPPPVLVVPGYTSSGPGHWQSLWERSHPWFRRVQQRDWENPRCADWVDALHETIVEHEEPVFLVAHSLGCIAVVHWARRFRHPVAGALLVAPADVERPGAPEPIRNFAPIPLRKLPFPSIVVSSSDDPYLSPERAAHFAACWGSRLVDTGAAGHVNTDAGFGPWPEGLALLAELGAVLPRAR